ncbi:class I SAM-dependent methyltransferase [Clostridium aminobutyricum]|uniref:SAM-dependent methyltransferase n=1 Tax=Clostridium aminobutyricum TaxID=33953 RepID=A0A939IIB9_CLOAM|nr:SAM-dependent methyltransferase [Clostridium aminobutyricum]MBN7772916.1 SAM-dependent methyltransferase [Clostridium aminobutyricum]
MNKLTELLDEIFDDDRAELLNKMIFGNLRKKSTLYKKVTIRPILLQGKPLFQAEYHYEKKVIQKNLDWFEANELAQQLIQEDFKQINIQTAHEDIQVLAAKPETPKITRKPVTGRDPVKLEHNQEKKYIIPDKKPCDFLIKLGVMSDDGTVFQKHYAKFRQINRFLEIVDDVMEYLPKEQAKPFKIIDFGCGKSYLTFALYYYLKLLKGHAIEIIGLDLKEDVIAFCNKTAQDLGYDGLTFLLGDIADYTSDHADMVVTLHACDTATDYALINAVKWKSKVILSVPCCQHELFSQIKNELHQPMYKHGILKDRFTELLTDGLRALKLEACGYEVSLIEFTSLEHTAKNIMLRAVLDSSPKASAVQRAEAEYQALKEYYQVNPTIDLLNK